MTALRTGGGLTKKQRVKLAPSEKQVETMCDKLMKLHGYVIIRFSQPRHTMQTKGVPDRKYFGTKRGDSLWFECKKLGGTQSTAQRAFQLAAQYCGETYVLGGVEELAAYLKRSIP